MEWPFIVALVLAIPVILLPVAYIWYLNIGGIYEWIKDTRKEETPEEAKAAFKKKYRDALHGR